MTVDEIRKETIERLIESRKKAGQDGYNEKQKGKENKGNFGTPTLIPGKDGYFLTMPNGDLKKVSKAVYDRRKAYIQNEVLSLPDA